MIWIIFLRLLRTLTPFAVQLDSRLLLHKMAHSFKWQTTRGATEKKRKNQLEKRQRQRQRRQPERTWKLQQIVLYYIKQQQQQQLLLLSPGILLLLSHISVVNIIFQMLRAQLKIKAMHKRKTDKKLKRKETKKRCQINKKNYCKNVFLFITNCSQGKNVVSNCKAWKIEHKAGKLLRWHCRAHSFL